MEKQMRLDKYLGEMQIGTRSQIKEAIKNNRVTVNGIVERESGRKVFPSSDIICYDGKEVNYVAVEYYMLHKPAGVITATEDKREKTVLDLMESKRKDLFPVGRLDKDTEGLLLITNDGDLAHRLLSPKRHVAKVYEARVAGKIGEEVVQKFAAGLILGDGTALKPAELDIVSYCDETEESLVRITIVEGKFHQIKRMFLAVGSEVRYLKRLSMGSLKLDENLALGEYRALTGEEISRLQGQALLFDLDGTLIDSMWIWPAIDEEYLGHYGYTVPEDLQTTIEGMSFTETAYYFKERFQIPDSIEQMKQEWNAMAFEFYAHRAALKPGALDLLITAKKNHFKLGIATSNSRELAEAALKNLGIYDYFDVILTSCDVCAGKPAPDVYLEAAKRVCVVPENCYVFEDVPLGIQAGINAGMTTVAVYDSWTDSVWEEKKAMADFAIRDFMEWSIR